MNALVLDDEPRYREHISRSLEQKGLRIHAVATTKEAREIVTELGIDLVIVDIKLAETTDGLQFADWARQQQGKPAIIVITGYGSPEYARRSRDLGAIAYLEKPFGFEELESHVQRAINERQLLREIHRMEQELAQVKHQTSDDAPLGALPIALLSPRGEVLHVSEAGQAALNAVVDPETTLPARVVDRDLLERLRSAAAHETGWGRTTLLRRDGVISHFQALVRSVRYADDESLAVFFQDAQSSSQKSIDELWFSLLLRAAQKPPHGAPT